MRGRAGIERACERSYDGSSLGHSTEEVEHAYDPSVLRRVRVKGGDNCTEAMGEGAGQQ